MEILYRISLGYATMGITVQDDIVIGTPPIAKWMMGKNINFITAWVKKKGGQIGINRNPEKED